MYALVRGAQQKRLEHAGFQIPSRDMIIIQSGVVQRGSKAITFFSTQNVCSAHQSRNSRPPSTRAFHGAPLDLEHAIDRAQFLRCAEVRPFFVAPSNTVCSPYKFTLSYLLWILPFRESSFFTFLIGENVFFHSLRCDVRQRIKSKRPYWYP